MKIILGSSSPWRKLILEQMGYQFEVMNPDIDEKAIRAKSPAVLTIKLAMAKRDALLSQITEPAVLVTSDQVVVWNGKIREKPKDAAECREYLLSYRENIPAVTITSVLVHNTYTGYECLVTDDAKIWFKNLTDADIERLISDGTIMNCAGGFAAGAEIFEPFIDRIEGERASLMGLPVRLVSKMIDEARNHIGRLK